jgi:response regulator of citrate/malate metabolism
MKRVLCIDDDASVARLISEVVDFCGFESILELDSMAAATKYQQDADIVAVLTDLMMPKLDGIDVLTVWQQNRPEVRRVLITAAPQEYTIKDALRSRVIQMVIAKPPSIADIRMALAWL